MIQDIILQIKLNALKLDERLQIEELEERILKLEKSIVIRTSMYLTASQQNSLTEQIYNKLIEVK